MTTRTRRDRGGQGLIGLVVTMLIIALLYHQGLLKLPKPASKEDLAPPVQQMPETAGLNAFKMAANQVKSSVSHYQMNKPGVPKDLDELHRETGLDLMKDPWGGRYYVQQGWLKCTGNPKVAEKVW